MAIVFASDLEKQVISAPSGDDKPPEKAAEPEPEKKADETSQEDKDKSAPAEGDKPESESKSAAKPDTADEGDESVRHKRPGKFERRIDRLTRDMAERDRKIAELESRLAGAKPEPPPNPNARPDEKEFQNYNDFVVALGAWSARQTIAEERALAQQQAAIQSFQNSIDAARKQFEDFDEVLDSHDHQISGVMDRAIQADENAGAILYHLGKHPEEIDRIVALGTIEQIRAITKLSLSLDRKEPVNKAPEADPKKQEQKRASAAPDPIKPLQNGKGEAAAGFNPYTAAADDPGWKAWMDKRNQEARKMGYR